MEAISRDKPVNIKSMAETWVKTACWLLKIGEHIALKSGVLVKKTNCVILVYNHELAVFIGDDLSLWAHL